MLIKPICQGKLSCWVPLLYNGPASHTQPPPQGACGQTTPTPHPPPRPDNTSPYLQESFPVGRLEQLLFSESGLVEKLTRIEGLIHGCEDCIRIARSSHVGDLWHSTADMSRCRRGARFGTKPLRIYLKVGTNGYCAGSLFQGCITAQPPRCSGSVWH